MPRILPQTYQDRQFCEKLFQRHFKLCNLWAAPSLTGHCHELVSQQPPYCQQGVGISVLLPYKTTSLYSTIIFLVTEQTAGSGHKLSGPTVAILSSGGTGDRHHGDLAYNVCVSNKLPTVF